MSRFQISFPSKSKAVSFPVPVMTYTCSPLVTGDGDDIFCFRARRSPSLSNRAQSVSPVSRSRHQRLMLAPSATFRNTRSPQMIGVAPVQAGISTFHATLVSGPHSVGRLVSALTPLRIGPRQ